MAAGSLHARHVLEYAYTRSLGPALREFFTGLQERRVVGVRAEDGRVLVPPQEYDPVTGRALHEYVPVSDRGEVVTWTWVGAPRPQQPFGRPFAYALVRLDGADAPLLHVVDAGRRDVMSSGMRVRARWKDEPSGGIGDLEAFVPEEVA